MKDNFNHDSSSLLPVICDNENPEERLRKALSLIQEAYHELDTVEAITVSPSDTDGLLYLVNRMRRFLVDNGVIIPAKNHSHINIISSLNHPAYCSVYDDGKCDCR